MGSFARKHSPLSECPCLLMPVLLPTSRIVSAIRSDYYRIAIGTTLSLVLGVSAGCDQALLLAGPSRRYLCESFPALLGACRGGPLECTCLFLPPRHRPYPAHHRVGFRVSPSKRFHDGSCNYNPLETLSALRAKSCSNNF